MTVSLAERLVARDFLGKDDVRLQFNFLTVDSPDLWPEAAEVHGRYQMPIIGKERSIGFDLHGVSLAQWEQVEEQYPIPEWKEESQPPTDDHIQRKEKALISKQAAIIEVSTGKTLPGGSIDQKVAYLSQLNPGEVKALYYHIQGVICNTHDGSLLASYNDLQSKRSPDVIEFNDFDAWKLATETGYIFRMQRPTDDYIMEFPLKNISSEVKLMIEMECKEPEPPLMPARDPVTKKLIPTQTVPDLKDPGYLTRLKAVTQKRVVMFFNACLPFELPGSNQKEQYEWLSKRLVGDVIRLRDFIEEDLCGYRSRYDFSSAV